MKNLLFVDSNIYLDFYRVRTEAALSLLDHLDAIRDVIIVTSQVEMEFKKNRQSAILETMSNMQQTLQMPRPGILSKDKSMRGLQTDINNIQKRIQTVTSRLRRVLADPVRHDPVYHVAQRIFTKDDDFNLTRECKFRKVIRQRALRRFLSGYPPRKKNDTSMGDAFNWEWIIEVAKTHRANVHIVSRDSDYGCQHKDSVFINDWLAQEFHDRTSLQRKITLYSRLSDALKHFRVTVTDAERAAEREMTKVLTEGDVKDMSARIDQYIKEILMSLGKDEINPPAPPCPPAK